MFVATVSWTSPHEALEWAERISNDQDRELAYITIGRRWRDLDEKAAEAWLLQSPLSEESRAEARTYPEGYRAFMREKTDGDGIS